MKLLICSDLQLGGGAIYGTPQVPRLADQARMLEAIATLIPEAGVTDAAFLGDAFQHRKPAVDELLVFYRWLSELPVELFMLAGNHDLRGPGLPSVLELFGHAGDGAAHHEYSEGANVFTRPAVRVLRAVDEYPDVALAFLPWSHPGYMRAVGMPTPVDIAEMMLKVAEGLREQVASLAPDAMPVMLTHHALSGMSLPNGLATSELVSEPVLDTHALLEQGWRFVFAGHIHSTDIVTDQLGRQAVSVGSPWVQDFGEAEGEHGVWILDAGADTIEHVPLADRRFETLDVTGEEAVEVEADFTGWNLEGAVVRVRIPCTEEQAARIDTAAIRRALYEAGAHKVMDVHLDVARRTRARAEGMAEDTKPLDAVDAWLEAAAIAPREGERLRDLTVELLEEI